MGSSPRQKVNFMENTLQTTDDLMKRLQEGALEQVLRCEDSLPAFPQYIASMCQARGETRELAVRRAGIERSYGYQLFNGTRKPSRDKVIQLAIGFGLDVKQTQDLLKVARQSPLVPQARRDAVILYALLHRLRFDAVQMLLERFDMIPLGT